MIRCLMRGSLIGLLSMVTVGVSAGVAVAEPCSVTAHLGARAVLVAGGAAVDIPVVHTCSPDGVFGGIDLEATEAVSHGRVAQAFDSTLEVTCDGTEHTSMVRMTPDNDIAFRRGTAVVRGSLHACDSSGLCTYVLLSDLVPILRP